MRSVAVTKTIDIRTAIPGPRSAAILERKTRVIANAKTIAIPILPDAVDELPETFTVTLSALTGGAALDGSSTMIVSINDNDGSFQPRAERGGGGPSDFALLALLAGVLLARFAARPRRPTPR